MDLDAIKLDLFIGRLYAYGFNKDVLKLLLSYLSNR